MLKPPCVSPALVLGAVEGVTAGSGLRTGAGVGAGVVTGAGEVPRLAALFVSVRSTRGCVGCGVGGAVGGAVEFRLLLLRAARWPPVVRGRRSEPSPRMTRAGVLEVLRATWTGV